MATMITSECINCGVCEPACPTDAIYQGGKEWELDGEKHPPLKQGIFFIVPEKCTECVGFHGYEACAAVCPVNCCVPDPGRVEAEEALLARAKKLVPGLTVGADVPSRFRNTAGRPTAAALSEAALAPKIQMTPPPAPPVVAAAVAPAPVATAPAPVAAAPAAAATVPAPPKPAPAAPAAAPAAAKAPAAVASPAAPAPASKPREPQPFPGELEMSFEESKELLDVQRVETPRQLKEVVAVLQPLLGALPAERKQTIERLVDDPRFFTAIGSTGMNALLNALLYPLLLGVLSMFVGAGAGESRIFVLAGCGVGLAFVETMVRLRHTLGGQPAGPARCGAAFYAPLLSPLFGRFLDSFRLGEQECTVGQDGFVNPLFDEKLERRRRYGEVYRLSHHRNGFSLEFEFPRVVPPSVVKQQLGLPDEMPDYECTLALQNSHFVVKGRVKDEKLRRAAAVSPGFPPDFTTTIGLPARVAGFKHRFRGKSLEVSLVRKL